jgi:hypothetical protein
MLESAGQVLQKTVGIDGMALGLKISLNSTAALSVLP